MLLCLGTSKKPITLEISNRIHNLLDFHIGEVERNEVLLAESFG
jgi:hypothetical protein